MDRTPSEGHGRGTAAHAGAAALCLALAACGGGRTPGWSEPRTNYAPSAPVVSGPSTGITLHPAAFGFSAVDPEGDPITFLVGGVAVSGNALTLVPAQAGSFPLRVTAQDTFGHTSMETVHPFQVGPNHPPVFSGPSDLEWQGSGPLLDRTAAVLVQDEDGDGLDLAWADAPLIQDAQGHLVPAVTAVLETVPSGFQVRLHGALPAGVGEIQAWLPLRARDLLPGSGAPVGTEATRNLFIHYQIVP